MPILVVPDPSLVVLVGPAGSGKSTFAAGRFAADEILSSDAFREQIAGDAADQRATRPAFARLERALAARLREGHLSVVDATSLTRGARSSLLRLARAAGVPAVAIVLDLPPDVVLARNAGRARVVDPEVVREHLARIRELVDGGSLEREGFEAVYRIRSPRELDAVEVVRAPATRRPVPAATARSPR
jgi:predicted kinase